MNETRTYTAFAGERLIASGSLESMLAQTKDHLDASDSERILIFEDQTGVQLDFDFRGTREEVLARLPSHPHFASTATPAATRSGPGRPKLGVVSREVSLLPRHWEWLGEQRGGASAAIRRLVDEARRSAGGADRFRAARDAVQAFMSVMAGNLPGYEEATRALYAGDPMQVRSLIRRWPRDIRNHVERLLEACPSAADAPAERREEERT